MRDPLRIKQLLPITDGFTVLSAVTDENGKTAFEDLTKEGWHYLFALVDGGEWDDDYVSIYEMDPIGCGEIDGAPYRIVSNHVCPRCGRPLKVSWDVNSDPHPTYNCACGFSTQKSKPEEGESK